MNSLQRRTGDRSASAAALWVAVGRWSRQLRPDRLPNYAVTDALAAKRRVLERREPKRLPQGTYHQLQTDARAVYEDWRQAGCPGMGEAIAITHQYLDKLGYSS